MESWMFKDPSLIADGLIKRSQRRAEKEQRDMERRRAKKSVLHKRQVIEAKKGK